MSGITDTQSLRFGQVTDPISYTMQADLANDVAAQLDAADTAASGTNGALKRPAVNVRRVTNQLFSVNVRAGIAFDNLVYDTNGMTNLGVNPLRACIVGTNSGTGIYQLFGQVTFSTTGASTSVELSFWKNGATQIAQRQGYLQVNTISSGCHVYLGTLADYMEMHFEYNGTGTPTVTFAQCWVRKVSL